MLVGVQQNGGWLAFDRFAAGWYIVGLQRDGSRLLSDFDRFAAGWK